MNDHPPIRIAVLGGDSTGKTSLVSRLTLNMVHEVHYPTRTQTNWLFDFIPTSKLAKAILDGQAHERLLLRTQGSQGPQPIFESPAISPYVLLSPLVFQSFINGFTRVKNQYKNRSTNHIKHIELTDRDTPFYGYIATSSNNGGNYNNRQGVRRIGNNSYWSSSNIQKINSNLKIPENYIPPSYTPISIDIIDTPGFKPEMVVPFLEVSLFRNLGKNILHGLADEPRRPVSTTSLLVASGASELNGKIDGYVFVYSAVPELSQYTKPPDYTKKDSKVDPNAASFQESTQSSVSVSSQQDFSANKISTNPNRTWSSFSSVSDGGFSLLEIIRNSILDAWTEFRNYQNRWDKGKETDVYSLVYSLKNMWKTERERNEKLEQLRSFKTKLDSIDLEPSSPDSPPPAIIVCTHLNDPLASPLLVEWGRTLATNWECGFVAIDSMDDCNVDVAISLLIKEIAEKEKLLTAIMTTKKSNTGTGNSLMNFIKA